MVLYRNGMREVLPEDAISTEIYVDRKLRSELYW